MGLKFLPVVMCVLLASGQTNGLLNILNGVVGGLGNTLNSVTGMLGLNDLPILGSILDNLASGQLDLVGLLRDVTDDVLDLVEQVLQIVMDLLNNLRQGVAAGTMTRAQIVANLQEIVSGLVQIQANAFDVRLNAMLELLGDITAIRRWHEAQSFGLNWTEAPYVFSAAKSASMCFGSEFRTGAPTHKKSPTMGLKFLPVVMCVLLASGQTNGLLNLLNGVVGGLSNTLNSVTSMLNLNDLPILGSILDNLASGQLDLVGLLRDVTDDVEQVLQIVMDLLNNLRQGVAAGTMTRAQIVANLQEIVSGLVQIQANAFDVRLNAMLELLGDITAIRRWHEAQSFGLNWTEAPYVFSAAKSASMCFGSEFRTGAPTHKKSPTMGLKFLPVVMCVLLASGQTNGLLNILNGVVGGLSNTLNSVTSMLNLNDLPILGSILDNLASGQLDLVGLLRDVTDDVEQVLQIVMDLLNNLRQAVAAGTMTRAQIVANLQEIVSGLVQIQANATNAQFNLLVEIAIDQLVMLRLELDSDGMQIV
ncbi:hypothetical protein BaRGS_00008741 [Batillaria attramentaria]|uniref:Uncharacterized protein n=1 Tax=Batillaria attramentaria TaxID=370345 RepID=A0ABD0LLJ5_9CAEN